MQKKTEEIKKLIHSIDFYTNEVISTLTVSKDSYRELISVALFKRCHSFCQSVDQTIHSGFSPSSKVLLRAAMESVFWLVAMSYDEEWALKFAYLDELSRLKNFNKMQNVKKEELKQTILQAFPDNFRDIIKQVIEKNGIKRITTEQVANAAKMNDWYTIVYSVLSATTHSSIRDIENLYITDEKKNIIGINTGPDFDQYESICIGICETMFYALLAIERIFKVGTAQFVKDSMDRLDHIVEKKLTIG